MDRVLDRIAEHVGTAPLFGGGELVVVGGVAALARDRGPRERLIAIVGLVPPGNGLALIDIREGSAKRTAAADPLGRGGRGRRRHGRQLPGHDPRAHDRLAR